MTVIVPEQEPDTSTAFAAGVAAATAAQATEDADQAAAQAEQAEQVAVAAADQAQSASGVAWDAQAAVAELSERTSQQFAALTDAIATLANPPAAVQEEDDMAPEATSETTDTPKDEKDKPEAESDSKPETTERNYGSTSWFGKRG